MTETLSPHTNHEAVVKAAAAVAQEIGSLAAEAERLGRLPDETVRLLDEAGLLKLLAPRARGGDHGSIDTFSDVAEELAKACGSTAWVASIYIGTLYMVAGFSDEEVMVFGRIFHNNAEIRDRHELGRFDGDALLVIAAESAPDAAAGSSAARWAPYVTGSVTEAAIACTHADLVRPEVLGEVANAVLAWLEDNR